MALPVVELTERLHPASFVLCETASRGDGRDAELRTDRGNRRRAGCDHAGAGHAAQTPIPGTFALIEVELWERDLFEIQILSASCRMETL